MKSMLKADDFYVLKKRTSYSGHSWVDRWWSVPGLMFMSDIMLQAVEKAGLEPSKVVIRVGDFSSGASYNDRISIAYPSPATTIVHDIKIEGNMLELVRRGKSRWDKNGTDKINLATPDLIDRITIIIKESLPKKSKYEKQDKHESDAK